MRTSPAAGGTTGRGSHGEAPRTFVVDAPAGRFHVSRIKDCRPSSEIIISSHQLFPSLDLCARNRSPRCGIGCGSRGAPPGREARAPPRRLRGDGWPPNCLVPTQVTLPLAMLKPGLRLQLLLGRSRARRLRPQAVGSVLEPHVSTAERFAEPGERVVVGQRLMQAAGDPLLGWVAGGEGGRHFYVRQLRDMKVSADLTRMGPKELNRYTEACGQVLAHAHARTGDPALIAGYLGKSAAFDEALADFAVAYANQTERRPRRAAAGDRGRQGRSPDRNLEGRRTRLDSKQGPTDYGSVAL